MQTTIDLEYHHAYTATAAHAEWFDRGYQDGLTGKRRPPRASYYCKVYDEGHNTAQAYLRLIMQEG